MKKLMRHPNGINTFEADPKQRARLLKLGWTDETPDVMIDPVDFTKNNEIQATIDAAREMPVTEVPADEVKFEGCCDKACVKDEHTQESEKVEVEEKPKPKPKRKPPTKRKKV